MRRHAAIYSPMRNRHALGALLKQIRGEIPVSQIAAAVGIGRTILYAYESGRRWPADGATLARILDACGASDGARADVRRLWNCCLPG